MLGFKTGISNFFLNILKFILAILISASGFVGLTSGDEIKDIDDVNKDVVTSYFTELGVKGLGIVLKNYSSKVLCDTKIAPQIAKAQPVTIKGEQYNVGFSCAEITPDLSTGKTYWLGGYGSGNKLEGVKTPIYASAVWIDCGNDEGMLWIGADIIGLTGVETNTVRNMLADFAKETGCKSINISSTHNHSGVDTMGYWGEANKISIPEDGKDPEFMQMLMETMVKVSKEAYADRKPGKLYSGNKQVDNSQSGARLPKTPFSKITRLRFVPDDGSTETWVLNFPAHPNTLGKNNRMISGEYPYYLREAVMEKNGANVFYGVGAIGGVDMVEYTWARYPDPFNEIKKQGELLADAAMSIDNDVELTPEISFIRQEFYYPNDNYILTVLAMWKTYNAFAYPSKTSGTGVSLKSELTYLKLGEKKIVLLPGEMFQQCVYGNYNDAETSSTGKGAGINPTPLCEVFEDPDLTVFGVTNDFTGYVVPPNDFILNQTQPYISPEFDRFGVKHYHETNSMGINSQKVITDQLIDMKNRMDAQEAIS